MARGTTRSQHKEQIRFGATHLFESNFRIN